MSLGSGECQFRPVAMVLRQRGSSGMAARDRLEAHNDCGINRKAEEE